MSNDGQTERRLAEDKLRANEELLRLATQMGQIGTYVIDYQTGIRTLSPQMRSILGLADDTEPTPEEMGNRIHPDDLARLQAAGQEALNPAGDGRSAIEVRVVRPGGEVRWVSFCGQAEFRDTTSGRAPCRHLGAAFDITKFKQMEQELREADRRKDEFLAVLSHELRTPLSAISNAVFLLRRSGAAEPGPIRRATDVLGRQVTHLTRLIDDLLDVARITHGKITLDRRQLALGDLVRQALETHRATFADRGVTLEAQLSSKVLWLDADATRLSQVIDNLLTNAAKFTRPGDRVEVCLQGNGAFALLSVRDTGVGITHELLAHIFEPFTQAPQELSRNHGGLGLGLTIVKGIVALHGGSVSAQSDGPGQGAQFTVRLPLTASGESASVVVQPPPQQPRRVLIIEDNRDTADSLEMALTLGGHEVQVADDGPDGLTRARDFHPDVVLCDIGLPQLDGYQVARALRADANHQGTLLIALSGYAQPADKQRAAEAGFTYHLAKPVDLATLLPLLETAATR